MVSNPLLGAQVLRPLFFISLIFSIFSTSYAQKLSKFYTSSLEGDARLYFIEPEIKFKNQDKDARLIFDLTYSDSNDSIRLSFSLLSKNLLKIDSVLIIQNNTIYFALAEKLFIQDAKKDWIHRYASMFRFTDLQTIFKNEDLVALKIISERETLLLSPKSGSWKKQSPIVTRIFELIDINRK